MTTNVGGTYTTYERFGGTKPQNISVAAEGAATMIITVTDKDGNVSEPVTKLFFNGVEMDADGGYGEDLIPDAALRAALEAQVGPTVADLLNYTDGLDLTGLDVASLSGLNLLTGLTTLNITDTKVESLEAADLPTSLTEVTAAGESLVYIHVPDRPNTALVLGELPNCVQVAVEYYGDHELNLTGIPNLTHLSLIGTAMQELDITANTKLQVFLMNDSAIASIDAAESYPDAYYWVWTNAKLDLSEDTVEGVLFSTMKNYFATTELPERVNEHVSTIYADSSYWATGGDLEVTVEVDGGWQHELTSVSFHNSYNDMNPANYFWRYNVIEATIYVSDDAENWTEVATYTGGDNWTIDTYADYSTITIELPAGTRGRYVKMVAPDLNDGTNYFDPNYGNGETPLRNGYPYIDSFTVNGHCIHYTGFYYAGQQPAVERDTIRPLTVSNDGAEYQTLDLLEAHYASTRTVASDSYLRAIEGADWLDADYVAAEAYMPAGVRVAITKDGESYIHPADTLGAVSTEKLAVNADTVVCHAQNSNEEGWRLFDGMTSTKWCGGDGGAMWLAFELTNGPAVLSEYNTLHAGCESKDFITYAWRLQYLNPEKMTEAEYLALDTTGKAAIAADASYWIDLSVVTGNSADSVNTEISMEDLVSAQVYRFQVDGSGQPGKQTWGALRIYEMELYAFEGNLDNVTNGLLKADEAGTYAVTYNVAKTAINSTTVTVESAAIASGWSGYTTWKLTADGTLTVSPSGELYNGKCNMKNYWKVDGVLTLPWGEYADQITKVVVEEGVDAIGQMAFYGLPNLETVVLADSVDEVRNYAFKNCASLTSVNLENVATICEGAFYGCAALSDVSFAEGVEIGEWAFSRTGVTLP